MAVGLITEPEQAEAIVANGQADMVALARGFLDDPHWAWHAAWKLGADVPVSVQYARATIKTWPPAKRYVPAAKAAEELTRLHAANGLFGSRPRALAACRRQ